MGIEITLFYLVTLIIAGSLFFYSLRHIGFVNVFVVMIALFLTEMLIAHYTIPSGLNLATDESALYTNYVDKTPRHEKIFGKMIMEGDIIKMEVLSVWVYTGFSILPTSSFISINGLDSTGVYGFHYLPKYVRLTTFGEKHSFALKKVDYLRRESEQIALNPKFMNEFDVNRRTLDQIIKEHKESVKELERIEKEEDQFVMLIDGEEINYIFEHWPGLNKYLEMLQERKRRLFDYGQIFGESLTFILTVIVMRYLQKQRGTFNIFQHTRLSIRRFIPQIIQRWIQ